MILYSKYKIVPEYQGTTQEIAKKKCQLAAEMVF